MLTRNKFWFWLLTLGVAIVALTALVLRVTLTR
jgi:hypothetical protein